MRCLFLEPFASLSHLYLYQSLVSLFPEWEWTLHSLPDRQWKWRNRLGALQFSQRIDIHAEYDVLIAGSLLHLPELLALCPQLHAARKIVYFHENQFAYPSRTALTESDKQIMYNSITTALSADVVLFNSQYNLNTFMKGADAFLNKLPVELECEAIMNQITSNSHVFPIPIRISPGDFAERSDPPAILWNHRWEHDKGPELFFEALFKLKEGGAGFQLIVAGERFDTAPAIFELARKKLHDHIVSFGFVPERAEYEKLLARADIVVSTAAQEFYGISIIEAVACGSVPVVPDALSYSELFPIDNRIPCGALESLVKKLSAFLDLGAGGLPTRQEVSELAKPYLQATDPDKWRQRFQRFVTVHD
ncbi:MAG: DUF3524 domain-containing protein [candidate division Zixibacteria bacterium]|nr:DUF3524 domain-containing protein [candidate division Zixibacteria bacterium]